MLKGEGRIGFNGDRIWIKRHNVDAVVVLFDEAAKRYATGEIKRVCVRGRNGHGVERMRRFVGRQEFGSGGCVFHDSKSEERWNRLRETMKDELMIGTRNADEMATVERWLCSEK